MDPRRLRTVDCERSTVDSPVHYNFYVNEAALEWIVERVLEALTGGESVSPAALTLLLRRYVATGRADLGDALGPALARALDRATSPDRPDDGRSEWLALFVEAAAISEDERLPAVAAAIVAALRGGWPGRGALAPALRSIDACLSAAHLGNEDVVAVAAIDELERIVGVSYEPGEGLAGGGLRDHAAGAATLLTAFAIAGRLPYAMLAEELIQFARRTWWDEERGGFHVERRTPNAERENVERENVERRTENDERFLANCDAARVLCRLAALHADPDYRQMAVIVAQCDYATDARRTLEALLPAYRDHGHGGAAYGLAIDEYLRVR